MSDFILDISLVFLVFEIVVEHSSSKAIRAPSMALRISIELSVELGCQRVLHAMLKFFRTNLEFTLQCGEGPC